MTDDSAFRVSQGFDVLPPKSGPAYPIPCEEWDLLKEKISKATSEPWFFHTLGSVLIGAALSALIPIVTGAFNLPDQIRVYYVTWLVLIVTAVCGGVCLFFAQKQRQMNRERASDVASQMQLIEQRYEREP